MADLCSQQVAHATIIRQVFFHLHVDSHHFKYKAERSDLELLWFSVFI